MSSSKTFLWVILLLIIVFLVWGFIGGSKAKEVGTDCDFGIGGGETLCWKWSKNSVGEIQEGLNELGKSIGESIQKLN